MNRKSKTFALSTVAVGIAVLVAVGFAARDLIREEWYVRQFEGAGDDEEKIQAAERLSKLGSARAAPWLLEELRKEGVPDFTERGKRIEASLLRIGKAAMPFLVKGLAASIGRHDEYALEARHVALHVASRLGFGTTEATEGGLIGAFKRFAADETQPQDAREAAAAVRRALEGQRQGWR